MKIGCWARELGDCAGKLSAEHIVSAGLWSGPRITAVGGPWGEVPRDIGVSSLTAKILCQRHNSRLSPLDAAAGSAFRQFAAVIALANARRGTPSKSWILHVFDVDGPLLERWFLKTAINIVTVLHGSPQWELEGVDGIPPLELVQAAFGVAPIRKPMGLYSIASLGDDISSREELQGEPLYSERGRVSSLQFQFRGFNFLLHMDQRIVLGIRHAAHGNAVMRTAADLRYHLERIVSDVGGLRSHFIQIAWPESQSTHFSA